jgi:hypothetical protein
MMSDLRRSSNRPDGLTASTGLINADFGELFIARDAKNAKETRRRDIV